MKIAQINAVFGSGSTGKIMNQLHDTLIEGGNESYSFWAINSTITHSDVVIRIGNIIDHKFHAILSRIDGKQGWHSYFATKSLVKTLKIINPDVVHLHNLHSNYINLKVLFDFFNKNNIPVLITLHDCWFFTGGCYHYIWHGCNQWKTECISCPFSTKSKSINKVFNLKKHLFYKNNNLYINGVSSWTEKAAKDSALFKNAKMITHIYNWVDTSLFRHIDGVKNEICLKYDLPNAKKIVIGVAQNWSVDKGLDEFVSIANRYSDSVFVILVGYDNGVLQLNNLKCLGYISDREELCRLFNASDVFVNASHAETFGLVTAEAMACGCPVVAYDNTGTSEVVDNNCGILVEDGNIDKLSEAVGTLLFSDTGITSNNCIKRVKENFSMDNQIAKYVELYKDIVFK